MASSPFVASEKPALCSSQEIVSVKVTRIANLTLNTICVLLIGLGTSLFAQESDVTFTRDIRPMLSDNCFHCHGNDEETREADLRLDIREVAVSTNAIVPGSPDDSTAYQRMISTDEDERMPPAHAHKTLTARQQEDFRVWIEQGAVYEQHWSYRPLRRPDVSLAFPSESPIDASIRNELKAQQLKPARPADRQTLARRLSLDLTGISPTSSDVEAFVNDRSDDAYEDLVDRLLASPAFGERMAVFWLDLVRYADSIGYHSDNEMEVSAYRDYVINSFNSNKPFDKFTIEQLAGDLLPNRTLEQTIASGYNRLLQTTEEGGAQAKEYIAIYAADRVRNVSGVWLGQTMGCAQCHDHKYDPITAKDFYAMSAFFADIKERPVGKRQKNLTIYSDEEKAIMASLAKQIADLKTKIASFKFDPERQQAQRLWEQSIVESSLNSEHFDWMIPQVSEIKVGKRESLQALGDGSFLRKGSQPNSNYRFRIKAAGKVSAIRLEALTDESFPVKGSLSDGNGNFILTAFEVSVSGQRIKIASAKADFSQNGWPAEHSIDGNKSTGWAVNGHAQKADRRVIIFTFDQPVDMDVVAADGLEIRMLHESSYKDHNIGRFRISLPTKVASESGFEFEGRTAAPEFLSAIASISPKQRSADQQHLLDEHFPPNALELQTRQNRLKQLNDRLVSVRNGARTMLVAEATAPRDTRILNRGDWMDESGEIVSPAVPAFLPWQNQVEGRRANRLDLAKWMFEPGNPLTARTFANRLWKIFHGRGLSYNLDDLGGQGEPPSHPELLDWLACEFRDGNWDVKRMVKLIVMTDTYRQSSVAHADVVQRDPSNRWYARQGRWRVDAEFVRDAALHLSGLLDTSDIGGRSVKPYQPKGYWQHLNFPKRKWQQATGNQLYRRSLYTFWCRSFLHPSMVAFDAPSREECVASRARSNIPQQALVLLNDPIFVEASRCFAERIMRIEGDRNQKITQAWRAAVSRDPSEAEIQLLTELYESQQKRYALSQDDAAALTAVGEAELPAGIDNRELAAWTQVARAILNAYETTARN